MRLCAVIVGAILDEFQTFPRAIFSWASIGHGEIRGQQTNTTQESGPIRPLHGHNTSNESNDTLAHTAEVPPNPPNAPPRRVAITHTTHHTTRYRSYTAVGLYRTCQASPVYTDHLDNGVYEGSALAVRGTRRYLGEVFLVVCTIRHKHAPQRQQPMSSTLRVSSSSHKKSTKKIDLT